jgi:hypothetical protein
LIKNKTDTRKKLFQKWDEKILKKSDLKNKRISFLLFAFLFNKNNFEDIEIKKSLDMNATVFYESLQKDQKKSFNQYLKNNSLRDSAFIVLESVIKQQRLQFLNYINDDYSEKKDFGSIISEIYLYIGYHFQKIENFGSSFLFFQRSLLLGNKFSNFFLATLYEIKLPHLKEKYKEHFNNALESKDHRSLLKLSIEKFNDENFDEAKNMLESLIEKGSPSAMNNMAYMFLYGYGVAQDFQKAFNLLKTSFFLGNKIAAFNLSNMFHNEKTLKIDKKEERKLLKISGLYPSSSHLNNIYHGYLLDENYEKDVRSKFSNLINFSLLLKDSQSIFECNKKLKEDCCCHFCSQRNGVLVIVYLPNSIGTRFVLLSENDSIYSLKKIIEFKDKISSKNLKASFRGTTLENVETVKSLSLKQNSVIHFDFIEINDNDNKIAPFVVKIKTISGKKLFVSTFNEQVIFI